MTGKRKASDDARAPALSRPPPPRRLRREAGYDEDNSTVSSGDCRSDGTYVADIDYSSSPTGSVNLSGESSGGDEIAMELQELNIQPQNQVPAEWEELDAAGGQHAEAVVQPQPPADHTAAEEVADQSVLAAAPTPEMVVPEADPVLCLGCGREPALLRRLPVAHGCLCLRCRSNSSGRPHCEVCDGPRRLSVKKIQGTRHWQSIHMQSEELVSSPFCN